MTGGVALACDRDGVVAGGPFEDAVFWLASMTKPVVAVAALQLVERGVLGLDQPVGDVLADFDALQVLDGFDGDAPVLRAPGSRATVRQLLTHTAGLGYWFCSADLNRYLEVTGVPDPGAGKLAMFEAPLLFDPGTSWAYGTGYDWLGRVIEELTGDDLEAALRRAIFDPLGMNDTCFRPTGEQRARMAAPQFAPSSDREYLSGGAGLVGTAGDYMRFLRALLRGGDGVLRPETTELMFTDQLQGVALPERIATAIPRLSNDILFPPVRRGWSFGLHLVLEDLPGMRAAGSGDWAGLANTYFWIDRTTGLAGVYLTQLLPFFDAETVAAFADFETEVYAEIRARSPAPRRRSSPTRG